MIQAKGGNFSYASSGNGTPQHLTGELFASVAKLNMVHVPYKGSAPAISDLLGGHIPMMFDSTIAIMPHIKSGKVKAIAISGAALAAAAGRADLRRSRRARPSSPTPGTACSRLPRRRRT